MPGLSETPPPLRGGYYSTNLTKRCDEYKRCCICSLCEKYDRFSQICCNCEERKLDKSTATCKCKPKQKETMVQLNTMFESPLFALGGQDLEKAQKGIEVPFDSKMEKLHSDVQENFVNSIVERTDVSEGSMYVDDYKTQ